MGTVHRTLLTPAEILDILGVTPSDVARATGLDVNSVRRATMGGVRRTNIKTARILAHFFGLSVDEISWPAGLTHIGRTPLTGRACISGYNSGGVGSIDGCDISDVLRDDQVPSHVKRPEFEPKFCTKHHLELPLSGVCDFCVA